METNKKVTIYSTPSCSYCQAAKEFFKAQGVTYEEHNVAVDVTRRQEMVDKSGQMGVPVITITDADGGNEELIIGFDQSRLSAALGL